MVQFYPDNSWKTITTCYPFLIPNADGRVATGYKRNTSQWYKTETVCWLSSMQPRGFKQVYNKLRSSLWKPRRYENLKAYL